MMTTTDLAEHADRLRDAMDRKVKRLSEERGTQTRDALLGQVRALGDRIWEIGRQTHTLLCADCLGPVGTDTRCPDCDYWS